MKITKKLYCFILYCFIILFIATIGFASPYKLNKFGVYRTNLDGSVSLIPTNNAEGNIDYQEYLVWLQDTNNIPDPTDTEIIIGSETWQTNKSSNLKIIEGIYVDFLTNDWTICLRTNSLINSTNIVTVENTDETQNITYLLQLRSVNKPEYYNMSGEFDRFKTTIERMGGIMGYVIKQ